LGAIFWPEDDRRGIRQVWIRVAVLVVMLMAAAGSVRAGDGLAVLSVDVEDGKVIADQGGEDPHHPASLTKLMTAYVAFDAMAKGQVAPGDQIQVSDAAAGQGGSRLGLRAGDKMTLAQALEAMIVRSANDAAVAVAEHVAGSEQAFAGRMTETARRLGMTATSFRNATGMTADGHLTTPRDMAVLALALLRDHGGRASLFARRDTRWKGRTLPSVNGFLANFQGAEGMKTGFTCHAGYNLVALARRGGRRVVTVVMGATSLDHRRAVAASAMAGALARPAMGPAVLAVANRPGVAPDLAGPACGRAAKGPHAGWAEAVTAPAGWALEVAQGIDKAKVTTAARAFLHHHSARLGRGARILVLIKPRSGVMRHRGIIGGLAEDKAIALCVGLRAQEGEAACSVMMPGMLQAALDDERRFKMISAE
jgi:D-alanyl-D-alanine carboxypeptidase